MSTEDTEALGDRTSSDQVQKQDVAVAGNGNKPQVHLQSPTPSGRILHNQQHTIGTPSSFAGLIPSGLVGTPVESLSRKDLEVDGPSPPSLSSGRALQGSLPIYSRHHPYATSVSPFEESGPMELFRGGPARTSRSHSRSSFDTVDGDYIPDDDPSYTDDSQHTREPRTPRSANDMYKRAVGSKEPVRLTATGKPSHARRLPPGHIKRPRNAFILFRSHACVNNLVPASLNITDHRHISRIVGQMWKNLQPEERKIWEDQAEKEKEEHRRAHPDYKYRPVYRREGIVRRRRKKAQDEKDIEDEERKCEVVARVLLEGGDVSEDRVEREVEIQRERDEQEGRIRGPAAKSPARSRRVSVPVQPAFDINYGMLQYGQHAYDPYQAQGPPVDPPRSSGLNMIYPRSGDLDEGEVFAAHAEAYGAPQRSHTMPPLQYNQHFYHPVNQLHGRADTHVLRAPPPPPLSLYRPGDASLAPPISPGILFGAGTDFQGYPTTPRTTAMHEHHLAIQQRFRTSTGSLLSPRSADFGLNPHRAARDVSNEGLLVSPTRPFQHDSTSLGFEAGFLDNALGAMGTGQHHQQNLEDRSETVDVAQDQPSLSVEESRAIDPEEQQTGTAPEDTGADVSGSGAPVSQNISFKPDADVTYVFLDAKQAQDQALVDSIRAQGFGITLDASQEEIAALTGTSLAAH